MGMKYSMRGGLLVSVLAVMAIFVAGRVPVPDANKLPVTPNTSFSPGEELDYRVNFGFFTVGKAITKIDRKLYTVQQKTCFKIDCYGETSDWISWITRVKDNWGAYLDTSSLNPHISYRKIREGKYRKDELVTFNHQDRRVEVKVMNQNTGVYENPQSYEIPQNAKDLVGGFMLLRVIDFKKLRLGDTLSILGFFEDASYTLKVMYTGKETITTDIGRIPCHKLVPIMPDNKLFDGENSITAWISDDGNKIPVKIQAKMFIGSTGIELIGFRGLRNQLRLVF
jgi:hypothetical protein